MTAGTDALKQAFRDFQTDGIPATGPNEPVKPEIRAALDELDLDIAAAGAGGDPEAVRAIVEPLRDDAVGAAGFSLRSDAVSFAPKLATNETTYVRTSDNGTHAAVAGEVRLDGTAATVGELIPNGGFYTKQASGVLWRTGSLGEQIATVQAGIATAAVASIAGQADTAGALKDIIAGLLGTSGISTLRIADPLGNFTQEIGPNGSGISTKPIIDLIIGYGQSNSTTWNPALTTSRGLSNLSMFIGGVVIADPNNQAATIPAGATDALVPLASDTRESFVTSCAEWLHDNAGLNVIAVTCGVNGQAYANLAKGQQPYTNLIACVTAAQAIAVAQGATLRVTIMFQHQEADFTDSRAAYRTKLDALTNDLNADISAITSQSVVHVFAGQAGSLSRSQPPLAAYEKAKQDTSGRFHLIPSFYALPYASGDQQHLDSYGRHNLGLIYGRAIKQVLSGLKYTPFQPKTAVRSGATITVTMEGQTGIPQIDTTAFADLGTGKGFEAFTSGGSAVAITSVAATNTGYTITFADSTVAATVALIRTAWTAPTGTGATQGSIKGAGTNLHDQATLVDPLNSRALPNWCVISETAVS